ncbi:MAG TPA: acetyltransferase [Dongiaceae bacterium]|nr:acetyltransferase [Dongiaceae bacterium]
MSEAKRPVALVGWEEGSAGQIHAWAAEAGLHIACFVHPEDRAPQVSRADAMRGRAARQFATPEGDRFKDLPLVSSAAWPAALRERGIGDVVVTLSDNERRHQEIARAREAGFALRAAIHPSALILPDAIVEAGAIVHAGTVVGYRAELAAGAILNVGGQVDHHCVLRSCCSIDPGAVLAGNVEVGALARICTGATVINRIQIGPRALVAAGAVVTANVAEGARVAGVPAKPMERRAE